MWTRWTRKDDNMRRRRSIPETPPMHIFSSAARELARLACDRPLSLPAINSCVCVRYLPSFLLLFFFACVSQHELRNLEPITRRQSFISIRSPLSKSTHFSESRIHSIYKINVYFPLVFFYLDLCLNELHLVREMCDFCIFK